MVSAMLAELGHAVVRAVDVDQALAALDRHPELDVVLTDLVMPGGRSGLDLAATVSERRPGLSVILSTGYAGEAQPLAAETPWPKTSPRGSRPPDAFPHRASRYCGLVRAGTRVYINSHRFCSF